MSNIHKILFFCFFLKLHSDFFSRVSCPWYLYPSQAARFPFLDSALTKKSQADAEPQSTEFIRPGNRNSLPFHFFFQWNFKKENETKQNRTVSPRAFARKETVRFAFVGCSGFPVRK
ncbi:MAG: hypothetical protein LUE24_13090, partial [Lachnospiraceae bacterium]|nr:hypothetical protein [Lachnospiraceae bacterium]